ncbi:uncharacterized protein LOC135200136 [Macrobrachium nipponense]|uniref:uncharacterized protein LOC135200136 n=1 Tax=Macrobrachium nipponense TaxID=159736 RepID=UPI0030C7DEA2
MAYNPLECDVCCNEFSDDHCPRILPCSHTLCGCCIDQIISKQTKACPVCKGAFAAMSAEDLLINRNLLDAAKQLSSGHKEPKAPSRGPASSFEELINGIRVNFTQKCMADYEEAETLVLSAIEKLKRMQDDALESQRGTEGLIHTLQKLQLSNENSLSNIDQNSKLLRDRLDVIRRKKAKIEKSDAELKKTTDFTAAGVIMDETKGMVDGAPEEFKEIEALLQQNEKERDVIKESLSSKIRLENASVELGRSEDDSFLNITVNVLRSLCGPLRSDAHREVFAVKIFEGKQRVARVKIGSKNQVSFNHLEEGDVPQKSYVIQLEYLMKMSAQRVFLDLGVDGTHLGRIIIKVKDEGNLALNFLHLCAGDLGTSYANSQVLDVESKGGDGENIDMGHYKMLLSGVDFKEETKRDIYEQTSWKAGDVRVHVPDNEDTTPVFYIVTRDYLETQTIGHCGTVEEGLGVLRRAILQYPAIQKIKIVECGLILSL